MSDIVIRVESTGTPRPNGPVPPPSPMAQPPQRSSGGGSWGGGSGGGSGGGDPPPGMGPGDFDFDGWMKQQAAEFNARQRQWEDQQKARAASQPVDIVGAGKKSFRDAADLQLGGPEVLQERADALKTDDARRQAEDATLGLDDWLARQERQQHESALKADAELRKKLTEESLKEEADLRKKLTEESLKDWLKDETEKRQKEREELVAKAKERFEKNTKELMEDPYNKAVADVEEGFQKRGDAEDAELAELEHLSDLQKDGFELDDAERKRFHDLDAKHFGGGLGGLGKQLLGGMGQAGLPGGGMANSLGGLLGGGGGAAGGLGGLAGAAGPVGAVVGLGVMVEKKIDQAIDGLTDSLLSAGDQVGKFAVGMARLDPGAVAGQFLDLVQKAGKGLNDALESVAGSLGKWVGKVNSFIIDAGVMLAQTFGSLVQAIDQTARKLAPYSGGLATAAAQADVRSLMGDIRRSQLLSPQLSEFLDAKSKAEQAASDLVAQLVMRSNLIPMLTRVLQGIQRLVEEGPQQAQDTVNTIIAMLNGLIDGLNSFRPPFTDAIGHIQSIDWQLKKTQQPDSFKFLDDLMALTSLGAP